MNTLQRVWDFLEELAVNNNKPWFDAHKEQYKNALQDFQTFAEQFIAGLTKFDKSLEGLTVKDCTYRIYRDLRFSMDKTPYKTHMGAFVCPQGKKSWNAGYYLHVEPCDTNMLVSGLYMPSPAMLKSVREEIMLEGEQFDKAVKACKGFELDWSSALKKTPKGFNADDAFADYYRLKDYTVIQTVTKEQVVAPDFLDFALQEFRKTYSLNEILNRCVAYANENL